MKIFSSIELVSSIAPIIFALFSKKLSSFTDMSLILFFFVSFVEKFNLSFETNLFLKETR